MTKVAVVAVHGVADQQPASSARQIADLLCADSQSYTEFTEVSVRIPRAPLLPGNESPTDPGLVYMHNQITDYVGDGAGSVYDTVRLEGKRNDGTDVHVHEVYWADLSRIGESSYRVFAELYQLLLHLPSLGRNAVEGACDDNGGGAWKVAHKLTTWAVWVFTAPIPLLNLAMLSLILIALSAEIPAGGAQLVVAAALPALVAFMGGALLLPRRKKPVSRGVFFGVFLVIVAAGLGGAVLLHKYADLYRWLAVEAAVVAVGVCAYIGSKYNVMKKGAFRTALVTSIVSAALAVYVVIPQPGSEVSVYTAALHAAEVISFAIVLSWCGFMVLALAAAIVGVVAVKTTPREKRRPASRAAWAGRFAVAFPAALFVTITMAMWFLITTGLGKIAPDAPYTALDLIGAMDFTKDPRIPDFMYKMVQQHALGIDITAAALSIFLLAAMWAAGPAVYQEVSAPEPDDHPEGVGRWLTRGIGLVAMTGDLLTWSFVLLLAIGMGLMRWNTDFLVPILGTLAAILGAVLTTKNLTTSVRAAVDVLLDVDNYMRERPSHATPRARIAERYISLLRHLCAKGYDKIVIVAHSQGTVISADLLRYLTKVPGAKSANRITNTPISLFTMGSPLRQLYADVFPYLYRWVNDDPLPDAPKSAPWLGAKARPMPDEVEVNQWVNAYRTGDYVGRHLWVNEEKSVDRIYIRSTPPYDDDDPKKPTRVQFCVGAGAHTHYWDRHGATIGEYINQMI